MSVNRNVRTVLVGVPPLEAAPPGRQPFEHPRSRPAARTWLERYGAARRRRPRSPRARAASASATSAFAVSYGADTALHRSRASPRWREAISRSSSRRASSPLAHSLAARTAGDGICSAIPSSSSRAPRACTASVKAPAISAFAVSIRARAKPSNAAPSRLRSIDASAAVASPRARSSSASPGCGSSPSSRARPNASAAPSRSPSRSRTSPSSCCATPEYTTLTSPTSSHARAASR